MHKRCTTITVIVDLIYLRLERTRMRIPAIALLLLYSSLQSQASSSGAQADFANDVTEACAAGSGLEQAQLASILWFDDTLNMVATLVSGLYPQPFMKGASGKVLCIYDKATGQTWFNEAEGWDAPFLSQ